MSFLLCLFLGVGLAWLMRSAVMGLQTSRTSQVLGTSLAGPLRSGLVEPVSDWVRTVSAIEPGPDQDEGGWALNWPADLDGTRLPAVSRGN